MNLYVVYKHTNKINGKVYIGITSQNPPENRWGTNGSKYDKKTYFGSAISKYGWDNFEHEILFSGLSKREACEKEIELIEAYNAQNRLYGYNGTSGGDAATMSIDARKKLSNSMRGNKNGLGKPCSLEKRKKISDAQKGTHFTDEHRLNISKAKTGKPHAPCSEETKKKISDKHTKNKVYCTETDTIYESIQSCARQLNLEATNICAVCKGKHKTHHGYHFRYYISDDNT